MTSDQTSIAESLEVRKDAQASKPPPSAPANDAETLVTPSSPSCPSDEKVVESKDASSQEAPISSTSPQPTATQPPVAKEKKSAFLLKPEQKTALKDFVVSFLQRDLNMLMRTYTDL